MKTILAALGAAVGATILAGCAGQPPARNDQAGAGGACARMTQAISPHRIGLPTKGAYIESANLVAASPLAMLPKLPFTPPPPEIAVIPAYPEHCRVIGAIIPVDPQAPPIRFQVNLPTQWNGNSLQLGGGGFNGTLVTGLALPPSPRPDLPSPLARGFVTVGTDSGHQNAPGVPLQAFALNEEALVNFAHASYKKVRDVSVGLMKRRYGSAPAKLKERLFLSSRDDVMDRSGRVRCLTKPRSVQRLLETVALYVQ